VWILEEVRGLVCVCLDLGGGERGGCRALNRGFAVNLSALHLPSPLTWRKMRRTWCFDWSGCFMLGVLAPLLFH